MRVVRRQREIPELRSHNGLIQASEIEDLSDAKDLFPCCIGELHSETSI